MKNVQIDSPLSVEDALGLLLDEQVPGGDAVARRGQGGAAGTAWRARHRCHGEVPAGGGLALFLGGRGLLVVVLRVMGMGL